MSAPSTIIPSLVDAEESWQMFVLKWHCLFKKLLLDDYFKDEKLNCCYVLPTGVPVHTGLHMCGYMHIQCTAVLFPRNATQGLEGMAQSGRAYHTYVEVIPHHRWRPGTAYTSLVSCLCMVVAVWYWMFQVTIPVQNIWITQTLQQTEDILSICLCLSQTHNETFEWFAPSLGHLQPMRV